MHHELIFEDQGIPPGYDSYSALLIPDDRWREHLYDQRIYSLFARFQRFGETIGPRHLAFWPYSGAVGNYHFLMDLIVSSVIFEAVSGKESARASVARRSVDYRYSPENLAGGYDSDRAKHFCAQLDLGFNDGPYIAFFDSRPTLPYLRGRRARDHEDERFTKNDIVVPLFVIQFGGLGYDEVFALINELEFEILKGRVSLPRLRFQQLRRRMLQACKSVASRLGMAVTLLDRARKVTGSNG